MEHYFTNDENLKSNFREIIYKIHDQELTFTSDLGVFSKDKVDFGSNLLVTNYIDHGRSDINLLDLGCGYGLIGITLAKIMNTKSTLVDVNKRAVHLANMNIKKNKVEALCFESNIYENIKNKYDVVITNPPIRAGKEIVKQFLLGAANYLNDDGELWLVIRKEQGAKSMIEILKKIYDVNILDKSKGFYIIVCKKLLT